MTSDKSSSLLKGFFIQWSKYFKADANIIVCGYKQPEEFSRPSSARFFSIGNMSDYPQNKWSNSLIRVLDTIADEIFIFMMDDYWLLREVDTKALQIIKDYMLQFTNVVRFDLTTDRLYSDPNKYIYGYNTYNTAGHLDLIKSDYHSPYHMSLWGGMWRKELLRKILISGETAQQIELNGTSRLSQFGDSMLVLGSRQAPVRHANVVQAGDWNNDKLVGLSALSKADLENLEKLGAI